MSTPRRKVFISYHHDDQKELEEFINTFDHKHDIFIYRAVGITENSLVNSTDAAYIMRRIRELYLADSTVTLVFIGKCTCARKYVDWEIASTLRNDPTNKRSGLMGIFSKELSKIADDGKLIQFAPPRLKDNCDSQYAKCYRYPSSASNLQQWIETAFEARTKLSDKVMNSRQLYSYNRSC